MTIKEINQVISELESKCIVCSGDVNGPIGHGHKGLSYRSCEHCDVELAKRKALAKLFFTKMHEGYFTSDVMVYNSEGRKNKTRKEVIC